MLPPMDTPEGSSAWVVPTLPVKPFLEQTGYVGRDVSGSAVSGVQSSENLAVAFAACDLYTTDINTRIGPTVGTTTGDIKESACNSTWQVACSAPVVIPARLLTQ
jgi:hypothetical protein